MLRPAYRLLAPGVLAAALSTPAQAAPEKKPPPAKGATGKTDKARKAANQTEGGADAKDKKPRDKTGEGESGEGESGAGKPEGAKPPADTDAEPEHKAKPEDTSTSAGESTAGKKASHGGTAEGKPEDKNQPPPPPPPRADEQEPRPYLELPPPEKPSRQVELGPHLGVQYLPADGSAVSYNAGPAWGAHARIELAPWMGLRLSFTRSTHAVTVPDGGLGLPAGTGIHQPDLSVLLLRARLEPTWVVSPRLRLWAAVGAGWGRISAPSVTTTGTEAGLHSAGRKGVMLEFSGALGASFDVIPDWLAASLMVAGGAVTNQSGEVFSRPQVFTADGHRLYMDGLPHFGGSLSALLGVGVLL